VSEFDDKIMEKFFEAPETITEAEVLAALRKACLANKVVPMVCGSAFKNKGVQTMLDYVMELMPSPLDKENIKGTNPDTEEEVSRRPSVDEPFAALAFKIATDPFVGRLAYFRAYSGKLDSGSYVLNTRSGNKERISRIFQMHANKQNQVDGIEAGDIGAAVGFKDIKTGDTLCDEKHPIVLEAMKFPEPVIGLAVEPKTQADLDKLGVALAKLAEEDPTFRVKSDEESGQTIISGMGELHLEIIVDRLKREFKVEVNQGAPQVNFKEAINSTVEHREVYKKQTGGRGKFADIKFSVGPVDAEFVPDAKNGGLQFVNEITGGNIPREFIPAIEKGFKASMANGILAGYPIQTMKVVVTDGSYHDVDSDALSFEICAKTAFREALPKAKPVLLEPIMKVEVLTPEQNMGDVVGDLNKRRGQIEGMDSRAGVQVVKAKVPLSEMFGYVTQLRTITSGRASSTMEFSHYADAPRNVADDVIAKANGKKAEKV
jgi:elongation factor G